MTLFGYVRVSTIEQNPERQKAILKEHGVEDRFIYMDKLSGKDKNRPELEKLLLILREEDVVIVESISRFARNTKDLLELLSVLDEKKVKFVSKKEAIDTSTPQGKFMLTVFGALAELEREQIRQRQAEGIAIAKEKGIYKGRKPIDIDEEAFREQYCAWKNGMTAPKFICKKLGISHATFYRRVKEYEESHGIIVKD